MMRALISGKIWLFLLLFALPVAAIAKDASRVEGIFAGNLRFPNSNQPSDDSNGFGEILGRIGFALYEDDRSRFSIFATSIISADTQKFSFNNTNRIGVGLRYRWKATKRLTLTFSARYDWLDQRNTEVSFNGPRYAIDAFYFRFWSAKPGATRFGLPVHSTVLRLFSTLSTPGSLQPGNDNVVLDFGGEISERLTLPNTEWRLASFIDLIGTWDLDRNNFNNRVIPAFGMRFEYPLETGSIRIGARLRADWRWINNTFDVKPGLVAGWFVAF